MNRWFDFTRRQLLFLASMGGLAVLLGGYLVIDRYLFSAPMPEPIPVFTGEVRSESSEPPVGRFVGQFTLDPNTAPADSLELLPGIGPTKAARIIEFRRTHRIVRAEDLLLVNGIGEKTLERIRPFLILPTI